MVISGASGAGKTHFLFALLEQRAKLFKPIPKNIFYYYGVEQKEFCDYPFINFIEGLPDISIIPRDELDGSIVIIDDQMESVDKNVVSLFTKYSHHLNFNLCICLQNFYHKNRHIRDITLQCGIIVLFDSPRDRTICLHLGKQLYPGKSNFLTSVFEKVIATPFGYLFIDLRVGVPEALRIRSRVLEEHPSAFVPADFNIKKWNQRKA